MTTADTPESLARALVKLAAELEQIAGRLEALQAQRGSLAPPPSPADAPITSVEACACWIRNNPRQSSAAVSRRVGYSYSHMKGFITPRLKQKGFRLTTKGWAAPDDGT